MRKLKLQMQLSIDGFVAGVDGEMDWLIWDWDDELKQYVMGITTPVDCILLGRKMAGGFIETWASMAKEPGIADAFTHKMNDTPKVVFSKTLESLSWPNTQLANGPLVQEINKLKNLPGGDIIVYGGGSFVSSLIQQGLIDEYHLFINPTILGHGMTIFGDVTDRQDLKLVSARSFDCGIVMMCYQSVID